MTGQDCQEENEAGECHKATTIVRNTHICVIKFYKRFQIENDMISNLLMSRT